MNESDVDDRTESWYPGEGDNAAYPLPVGEAVVFIRIEDQYGKFPVRSLIDQNGKLKTGAREYEALIRLFEALELEGADPEELANALLDAQRRFDQGEEA